MKLSIKLLVCMSLCVATVASAVPFSEVIDQDAELYLGVRDISESRAQWKEHSLTQLWQDEQLQAFLAPLFDFEGGAVTDADKPDFTEVLKDEFGLTLDELYEMLPGQAALVFYNLSELMLKEGKGPDAVFMIECSATEDEVDRLMQVQFERNANLQKAINPEIEHEWVEETFMGELLHFDETFDGTNTYVEDGYAFVDGIYVLAASKERLRTAVEAIKEGPDQPLAESEAFLRAREASGRGDLSLYVNLEAIMPVLNERWLGKPLPEAWAFVGITSQSLSSALDLESMQAMYVDADLIDDGALIYSGWIYSEKSGLASLVAYGDGGLPDVQYVPNGVFASSVSRFDLSGMLANLEQLITVASPTIMPMVEMSLFKFKNDTGVDVRSAFIDNFGDAAVSVSQLSTEGEALNPLMLSEDVYLFDVKDGAVLSQAFEAFKDLAPPVKSMIKSQEFEGHTIYTFAGPSTPGQATVDVSYVITRDKLILSTGRVGLLQSLLTRMAENGDGFWQDPNVVRLFERIAQPGAVSRSYVNAEYLIEPVLRAMVDGAMFGGMAKRLDASKVPTDLDAPYRFLSEVNESSDGLFSRTLLIKVESE